MGLRTLLLAALLAPAACFAQQQAYRVVSLDAVFAQWDAATRALTPGVTLLPPQKLHFIATYDALPQPCSTRVLETIFATLGMAATLQQVPIHHCIRFSAASGRAVIAWVQDVLVPALNEDARPGAPIELWVDLLAYGVDEDRSRNMPFMLVNRFEPK